MKKSFTPLERRFIMKRSVCGKKSSKSDSLTGFTLIEILISITIFVFLLLALNTFLGSAFSSTFRALAMKRLADSTRNTLEIMGREMRLAQGDGSPCTQAGSPGPSFLLTGASQITYKDFSGRCIVYRYDSANKVLRKNISSAGEQDFLGTMNASKNVSVENVAFTLIQPTLINDASSLLPAQPRVVINIRVSTKDPTSANNTLNIDLQTTLSQREIR